MSQWCALSFWYFVLFVICYRLFPVTAAFAEFLLIRYLFPVNCFGNRGISRVTSAHLLTATVPGCIPLLHFYSSLSDSALSLSSPLSLPSVSMSSSPLFSFQGRSSGAIGSPSRA